MAAVKFTATRGKPTLKDVTVAAGTTIAGSDAVEVNIDYTKIGKNDALILIEAVRQKIFVGKWPPL